MLPVILIMFIVFNNFHSVCNRYFHRFSTTKHCFFSRDVPNKNQNFASKLKDKFLALAVKLKTRLNDIRNYDNDYEIRTSTQKYSSKKVLCFLWRVRMPKL